ncbi:MAG: hypothetical protein AB3N63_03535 [Puniceicoccaceae bacterium]
MNWTILSTSAEIIGSLAVVISVIYLAIQIRLGAKTLRTTMRDNAFQSLQEWNYAVAGDPDLPSIISRGSKDLDSLNPKERARFIHIMFSFFKVWERLYLHYLEGSVDETVWTRNKLFLASYLHQPGSRYYWDNRKAAYDPRFQEEADKMEAPPIPPTSKLVDGSEDN